MSAPQVEQGRLRAKECLTDPLLVEVTGRDFMWHFRYSGPDGKLDTVDDVSTSEALYLPCDHEIRLVVHSEDYIYYMSVPELNLRQVAVPELTFEKSFRTQNAGDFEIPPDSMCGMRFFHDRLMGRVIVQPESQFIDSLSDISTSAIEARAAYLSNAR